MSVEYWSTLLALVNWAPPGVRLTSAMAAAAKNIARA
jgi:hypothetical protein